MENLKLKDHEKEDSRPPQDQQYATWPKKLHHYGTSSKDLLFCLLQL